jgi:NAD(P)H-quinone oxidoreductase subunit 4L
MGEKNMISLSYFLVFAAALFCIGLYGVLARKLMLNAVVVNLIAFWRFRAPETITGQAFGVIVFAVAAAEVAVGLALFIAIYRRRNTISADEIDLLKW